MIRTANPVFTSQGFGSSARWGDVDRTSSQADFEKRATTMTVSGTVNATIILLGMCAASAAAAWALIQNQMLPATPIWIGGAIGGLALSLVMVFANRLAPVLASLYAIVEGAFLGAVSFAFAKWIGPAVVFQALALTMGILGTLLVGYRLGFLRLGSTATKMVIAATGGIFLVYMLSFVMSFFGASIGFIHSGGPIGIGFSLVVIVIASLNLVLDFQFIEAGAARGLPKRFEWVGAWGLLVTLVWLYIEILRLLSKLQSRN